jgi:hypothetical protein
MNAFQLWMVGLFMAASLVALCLAGLCFLLWQRRPKHEPVVETKVKERLIELADPHTMHHQKTA